jgi:hypothetical protein
LEGYEFSPKSNGGYWASRSRPGRFAGEYLNTNRAFSLQETPFFLPFFKSSQTPTLTASAFTGSTGLIRADNL